MVTVDANEAQEHRRQVLDDQVQLTRALAMVSPTPASLVAYGRAELERLAADPPVEDDGECPF